MKWKLQNSTVGQILIDWSFSFISRFIDVPANARDKVAMFNINQARPLEEHLWDIQAKIHVFVTPYLKKSFSSLITQRTDNVITWSFTISLQSKLFHLVRTYQRSRIKGFLLLNFFFFKCWRWRIWQYCPTHMDISAHQGDLRSLSWYI